jgi:pimeloyl-ACP methyl ester carboxylesterase
LLERLRRTRWPDEVRGAGWDYGTNLSYLKEVVAYWISGFDWRKTEEAMNRFPQFTAEIDGLHIHFIHVRGKNPKPSALILTHGWPSSFFEMHKIIDPLSERFDIVVPSLPGFGFSQRPLSRTMVAVDTIWRKLMTEALGYKKFAAHGVDIGARITSALGRNHADVVTGIHIGSVDLDWPHPMPGEDTLSEAEKDYLRRVARWEKEEGAYIEIQATRPQTLAYGLTDSPAGLAAWILEKFRAWSDCDGNVESRFSKDELLSTITLYWVTNTINSSNRRYYDKRHQKVAPEMMRKVTVPTGIAMFPGEKDLVVPRSWAERAYNIVHWTDMPRGGHFPAQEEPVLLVKDIIAFFEQ